MIYKIQNTLLFVHFLFCKTCSLWIKYILVDRKRPFYIATGYRCVLEIFFYFSVFSIHNCRNVIKSGFLLKTASNFCRRPHPKSLGILLKLLIATSNVVNPSFNLRFRFSKYVISLGKFPKCSWRNNNWFFKFGICVSSLHSEILRASSFKHVTKFCKLSKFSA